MSNKQDDIHFAHVANAIEHITRNCRKQSSLFDVAEAADIDPFQQLLTEWAGVSVKDFLQYISISRAKKILEKGQGRLTKVAPETELSNIPQLHNPLIYIEKITPAEYGVGGRGMVINYIFSKTLFGEILVASTSKGVCCMTFCDNCGQALAELKHHYPSATFEKRSDNFQERALAVFSMNCTHLNEVKLHLHGTEFQLKVWEVLLKIPMGALTTYGDIANYLDNPKSSRAVGTAVGDNPVAFLIPCHRVIRSTGALGGYRWGLTRKTALIGWEAARVKEPGD